MGFVDAADTGRRLQAARALAGLERRTLAKALDIPGLGEKTLGAVERGEREMKSHEVAPIANVLGVSPAFFTADLSTLGEGAAEDDLAGAVNKLLQLVAHLDTGQDELLKRLQEVSERLDQLSGDDVELPPLERREPPPVRPRARDAAANS